MIRTIETRDKGIHLPCFGMLDEIHAALLKEFDWEGNTVIINGTGYTVIKEGFQSNASGLPLSPGVMAYQNKGIAIIMGYIHEDEETPAYYEVFTSGNVPHVSRRCKICGDQLVQHEINREYCDKCYREGVRFCPDEQRF